MKGFKNRKEFEEWAFDQFNRYGIRQPDTYSEQELIDLNPSVPVDFIRQHVKKRDKMSQ
jgi:hypothetical protein